MTGVCLVAVPGYNYKRACYTHHTTTDQGQLDLLHAAHWEHQRASYVYLGPMQELLLHRIIAMPGCSQRAATAPFRWQGNAERAVRRLRDKGLITIGHGGGPAYALHATVRGLWWADFPRNDARSGWTTELVGGIAVRRNYRQHDDREHTLERLIRRAETTSDYELRDRLIDEVGALVREQIARVTGRAGASS